MKRALVTAEPLSQRQVVGVVRFPFLWSIFPIHLRAVGGNCIGGAGEPLFVWLKLLVSVAQNLTLVWTSSVCSISGAPDAKAIGFNHMRHRFDSPSPTSIGNSCRLNGRLQNLLNLVAAPGQHYEQRGEREKAHHVQEKGFPRESVLDKQNRPDNEHHESHWLLIISMYFAISCAVFRMDCVWRVGS